MLSQKLASVAAVIFFLATPIQAQTTIQPFGSGAIVNTPGQAPTTIEPFGNGAIVNTPGQLPSTIRPFGNGAIVNTPGQPPTTVQPFGNGAIINTPGQIPTTIQPFGNGAIVNTPGQPPAVVNPLVTGSRLTSRQGAGIANGPPCAADVTPPQPSSAAHPCGHSRAMPRPWRRCALGRLARRARAPSSYSTRKPVQQRRHIKIGIQMRPRPKCGRADLDIRQMVRASARQPLGQPRRERGAPVFSTTATRAADGRSAPIPHGHPPARTPSAPPPAPTLVGWVLTHHFGPATEVRAHNNGSTPS